MDTHFKQSKAEVHSQKQVKYQWNFMLFGLSSKPKPDSHEGGEIIKRKLWQIGMITALLYELSRLAFDDIWTTFHPKQSLGMAKGAPSNSGSRRTERERERSKARKFSRPSSSSVQHSKRVSFKAEDEVIFSDLTNNIINLAADSMNNFSSSLFDSYEIKALSKYVLSLNPPASYSYDDGLSKKGWKDFGFSYVECLPSASAGMRGFKPSRGASCICGFP